MFVARLTLLLRRMICISQSAYSLRATDFRLFLMSTDLMSFFSFTDSYVNAYLYTVIPTFVGPKMRWMLPFVQKRRFRFVNNSWVSRSHREAGKRSTTSLLVAWPMHIRMRCWCDEYWSSSLFLFLLDGAILQRSFGFIRWIMKWECRVGWQTPFAWSEWVMFAFGTWYNASRRAR